MRKCAFFKDSTRVLFSPQISNDIGQILDEEFDIAVRTGYHCAPYIHHYLKDASYGGTIRVGIGVFNTEEDIDLLIEAIETL